MKTIRTVLILFFSLAVVSLSYGQDARDQRLRMKGYVNPQEIVSLDSAWSMSQALSVLNEMAKEHAGKVIVDMEKSKKPIGITIVNQQWRDALEAILTHNGLWYSEEADFIRIIQGNPSSQVQGVLPSAPGLAAEPPPTLESRDVKISAVFFTANVSKLQNYGISWNFFHAKKNNEPQVNTSFSAGISKQDLSDSITSNAVAAISSPPNFTFANIDALVKFFGTNNLGDVVTSPEVIVRNNREGFIQIGKDFFITQRDIAGNTVQQQVSTGTIIKVTPTIYSQSDTDFIALQLQIEQSDIGAGNTISKTQVKTFAILYDGEETVLGGLYGTIDNEERDGIPFLKDLPWWFFGFRYIFGSESIVKSKQELIVLLKAELVPTVRARIFDKINNRELIEKKRKDFRDSYDKNK